MALDLASTKADTPTDAPVAEAQATRPGAIDLGQAQPVTPADAPVKMPAIAQAGVELVKWILVMISCFVVGALIWITVSEFKYQCSVNALIRVSKSDPQLSASAKELMEFTKTVRTEFREFWLKIFQMVLLNVLLPVLTALLGYVFGSRQHDSH